MPPERKSSKEVTGMSRNIRPETAIFCFSTALLLAQLTSGCTKTEDFIPPPDFRPQDTEDNVLYNLQQAYKQRKYDEYAKLLADDFQFYFDEGTRTLKGLPESWNRFEDSTETARLFLSAEILDIRIELHYQPTAIPVNELGKENWTKIDVLDTFLEVDQAPKPGEVEATTFRVDGQLQNFFFRKGRTPADTLPESPTSSLVYLVEWRDRGEGSNSVSGLIAKN
jgi:hypothetical protein